MASFNTGKGEKGSVYPIPTFPKPNCNLNSKTLVNNNPLQMEVIDHIFMSIPRYQARNRTNLAY